MSSTNTNTNTNTNTDTNTDTDTNTNTNATNNTNTNTKRIITTTTFPSTTTTTTTTTTTNNNNATTRSDTNTNTNTNLTNHFNFQDGGQDMDWSLFGSFEQNRSASSITFDPLVDDPINAYFITPPPSAELGNMWLALLVYSVAAWYLSQVPPMPHDMPYAL